MSELNLPTIEQLEAAWNEGKPFEWRGKDGTSVDTKNRAYIFYPTPTPREDVFCYEAVEFTYHSQITFWKKKESSIRIVGMLTLTRSGYNRELSELDKYAMELAEKHQLRYRKR